MEILYVSMTDEQVAQLGLVEAQVAAAQAEGKPGAILGQVWPEERMFSAVFCPELMASEIYMIVKKYRG